MAERVDAHVIGFLEQAGERFLSTLSPELYRLFLLQIGRAPTLRRYDASETYWNQVQAILDCFFTSAERAEICGWLLERPELQARPEFRSFLARALAERRLQGLIVAAKLGSPAASR